MRDTHHHIYIMLDDIMLEDVMLEDVGLEDAVLAYFGFEDIMWDGGKNYVSFECGLDLSGITSNQSKDIIKSFVTVRRNTRPEYLLNVRRSVMAERSLKSGCSHYHCIQRVTSAGREDGAGIDDPQNHVVQLF